MPLIISPLGFVFFLLIIFIFRKKKRFLYSGIISLFVFSNGVLSDSLWKILEYPWRRIDYVEVNPADLIVVLSGGRHIPPGNTKIIEWNDPDRFVAGIKLFRSKKADKLIFTNGINPLSKSFPPEGDIYIKEAISLGIPREKLLTTYPVKNTLEEAKAIKKLLKKDLKLSSNRIILVTSAFHMKRAKRVFEREGIKVQPYPVDFKSSSKSIQSLMKNPMKWIPSAGALKSISNAFREFIGRIVYRT